MSDITLPKTKLGSTDWEVSRLGLGGFHQVFRVRHHAEDRACPVAYPGNIVC